MTIYVDTPVWTYKSNSHGWCHMATDGDVTELHHFADKIGLNRCWFQNKRGRHQPHYDLSPKARRKAVACGAVAVDAQELFKRCFRKGGTP